MPAPPDIVVVLPNWVGDVVMATPALRAVRSAFAHSSITLVGKRVALDTLAALPIAEKTICDPSRPGPLVRGTLNLTGLLRAGRHDIALILPNSFRSAFVAKMAGIARLVGYDRDGRGWMLTDALDPPRDDEGRLTPISAIDYYINLVALLGATPDSRQMHLMVAPSKSGPRSARTLSGCRGLAAFITDTSGKKQPSRSPIGTIGRNGSARMDFEDTQLLT